MPECTCVIKDISPNVGELLALNTPLYIYCDNCGKDIMVYRILLKYLGDWTVDGSYVHYFMHRSINCHGCNKSLNVLKIYCGGIPIQIPNKIEKRENK